MTDQWTNRLSEYVDGTLERTVRDELERHLAECGDCRDVLRDLGRVVERARTLPAQPPARDLWAGVAQRIGATPGHRPGVDSSRRVTWLARRFSLSVPQLAAAALVPILVAAALVTVILVGRNPNNPVAINGDTTSISPRLVPVSTPRLDAAVAELEQVLREGRGRLDSTTVRVIEQSLAIINTAIGEAETALAHDPANTFLNRHLTNQKLRKLDVLRRANELAAART
ncbi:MAG TPA: zf-HC2 domain-containing protein [Gemmatimonadales bacterium]